MILGYREDVTELDFEDSVLLAGDVEGIVSIGIGIGCSSCRVFRMIRSDSSLNMTSSRFR